MTEGRRSRVFDTAIRRLFGRVGAVAKVQALAPGIRELTFRADPPTGGWQPGHDIELWVGDGIVRHYTVSRVETTDRFDIVADLYSHGPGARWLAQAEPGIPAEIAASRHKDRPLAPGRAALLGDASAIGLLRAIQEHRAPDGMVVIECPADSVAALRAWAPDLQFVAQTPVPGESLHRRLQAMLDQQVGAEAFFLAGHAQTIQRLRATLSACGVHRRAISTRAHWATGKTGL